jgi:hypothetical protein
MTRRKPELQKCPIRENKAQKKEHTHTHLDQQANARNSPTLMMMPSVGIVTASMIPVDHVSQTTI